MDMITIFGLVISAIGIVGGMLLEGGHLSAIVQGTAAVIVFGGTIGAVLVGTTKKDLRTGLALLRLGFSSADPVRNKKVMNELVEAAQVARRESLLALEPRLARMSDPFMRQVFRYMIDGVDPKVIREVFDAKLAVEEEAQLAGAKIYTDAGGFAPTVGIIGAVLGLIHVMSNLTETSQLGAGIAVAFVATVYGVASANLLFLPLGNKIKRKIRQHFETKEMILDGVIGIVAGLSPFVIEEKLRSYVDDPADGKAQGAA